MVVIGVVAEGEVLRNKVMEGSLATKDETRNSGYGGYVSVRVNVTVCKGIFTIIFPHKLVEGKCGRWHRGRERIYKQ